MPRTTGTAGQQDTQQRRIKCANWGGLQLQGKPCPAVLVEYITWPSSLRLSYTPRHVHQAARVAALPPCRGKNPGFPEEGRGARRTSLSRLGRLLVLESSSREEGWRTPKGTAATRGRVAALSKAKWDLLLRASSSSVASWGLNKSDSPQATIPAGGHAGPMIPCTRSRRVPRRRSGGRSTFFDSHTA